MAVALFIRSRDQGDRAAGWKLPTERKQLTGPSITSTQKLCISLPARMKHLVEQQDV